MSLPGDTTSSGGTVARACGDQGPAVEAGGAAPGRGGFGGTGV